MPQKKLVPKTVVSKQFRDILNQMHEAISLAEQALKKMPGSRDAAVSVDSIFDPDHSLGQFARLEYYDDGLYVVFYQMNPQNGQDEIGSTKRLADLSTKARIEVAGCIPNLLRCAKEHEGKIGDLALEAAESIMNAVEETMEGDK